MAASDLCPSCFTALTTAQCAACGWTSGTDNSPPCLAQGILLDGRYQVGRVLGHGGFGVTYLGWDINLKTRRAIKEYLPSDLATRAAGETRVAVFIGEREEHFRAGLDRFLQTSYNLRLRTPYFYPDNPSSARCAAHVGH